ncbi:MAG: trigger factor [Candidatus Omnitrophica bacterium]|nr:trigger factor [Candidatus Omnitrophota bacterium]
MKVKVKESAKCQKTLEIEVPKQVVQEEFIQCYKELKKTAQIPGFRKGKAPQEVLEKHFSDKANDKVLTNVLNDAYHEAIKKENIQPVSMPDISDVNFTKDEKLTFKAKVDIRPKITLKDYKGIKVKKEKVNITEVDINKVVGYLQDRYAQFLLVEEKRGVKIGDYIICDYSYEVEGKQIDKKEHAWLWVDEEMFLPCLSKKIEGIKAGENRKFDIKLPEKFHFAELAGKNAQFDITVKEIKAKKLPEVNDEFAKKIGKNSLQELKLQIKDDLTHEKETQNKQAAKAQVIGHLVEVMPIDVPQALVDKREQALKETSAQRLKQQGVNDAQIEAELEKMKDLLKNEALKQVRSFFLLEDIAGKENIEVSEGEMNEHIEVMARVYNQKKEDLIKYLQKNKMLESMHWEVWEEKIIGFLIDNAVIEDVTGK